MNLTPKPRLEVFDTYWKFAAERQRIFYRRLQGHPAPWTEDQIMLNYKFCNAFRASDRVSQYLIRHVIYGSHLSQEPEDIVFRLLLFRFFNMSETWDLLERSFGDPRISNFDVEKWFKAMDNGGPLFSGAYMLCGVKSFGYDKKHGNYLALVKHLLDEGVVSKILNAKSLKEVYESIYGYPLIGKFLAYQIATDLNYSPVVNFEENSFTMAGPGAERGIAKCFESTGGMSTEDVIRWMGDHQEENFKRLGVEPGTHTLWGRPLQAIDIQNCFCETDKYCRVAFPGMEGSAGKVKIKTIFRASSKPAEPLFYPPKWGLNERLSVVPEVDRVESADTDLFASMFLR